MSINKADQSFKELADKFKSVISGCNKKSYVDSIEKSGFSGVYEVKNATSVEHYALDNGIHVYKFLNGTQPINYWISSKPIYENGKYTGASYFEYCGGGIGNGIGTENSIFSDKSATISVLTNDFDIRPMLSVISYPGVQLHKSELSLHISPYSDERQYWDDGDLYNYIMTFTPRTSLGEPEVVEELKGTLTKVDEYHLAASKSKEKRGLLGLLIGKNKELDAKLSVFGKDSERMKH